MNPPKRPSLTALKRQVIEWNQTHPLPGTPVIVRLDDGTEKHTRTQSEAQILGDHSAVIWLDGISGAYLLDRVRVAPVSEEAPLVVRLSFNPSASNDLDIRKVFEDPLASTIWCLWRRGHLCSDLLSLLVLRIVERMRAQNPQNDEQLIRCFPPHAADMPSADVISFGAQYADYLLGKKTLKIVLP